MISGMRASAVALVLALPLAACDSPFGAQDAALRVTLDSEIGSSLATSMLSASMSASEATAPGGRTGNGPVSLESVQSITVGVNQVLILPGDTTAEAAEGDDSQAWIPLTVTTSEIDLMALSSLSTLAELSEGAGVSGPIAAVRLVFGTSSVTFKDGSSESLFIPSGKVTLETVDLVLDDAATTLPLTFLQAASVKKIIRTGRGLLMPPVFSVAGQVQDEDESD